MTKTTTVCDVCRGDGAGTSFTSLCDGKVHVCEACNKGPVGELVRAVFANPKPTCRCWQLQGSQQWNHR